MTTLVLLPGMDGSGLLFRSFISALDSDLTPLVIDYPGAQCLSYSQLTSLVQQRLPPRERYFLLGESFSGPVAIAVAAASPMNLAGLVLCGTFARNPFPALAALK
jgi:pimeloyl-ACP methyl ester carboxylesterase